MSIRPVSGSDSCPTARTRLSSPGSAIRAEGYAVDLIAVTGDGLADGGGCMRVLTSHRSTALPSVAAMLRPSGL